MAATSGQWVHMVGIAGAGMSGIARILTEQGFKVSGSDLQNNNITQQLQEMGIKIYQGHSSSNIQEGVDLLVVSSAIPLNNAELQSAREKNIPVIKRGQMLANLVNKQKGIAVAGAHGKTTTTAMIYCVLKECGIDPTFAAGGELQDAQINAKLGSSDYFVVEADESDASFLELEPYIAIITNVEDDHLDYYKSVANIQKAFSDYINKVNPSGFALLYGGDEFTKKLKEHTGTRCIVYGETEDCDYYLNDWQTNGTGATFGVYHHSEYLGQVRLSVPGRHNAVNALAAIAVALEIGLEFKAVGAAILKFKGTKRRFQIMGKKNGIIVIDDYAHHPTEIKATLDAARNCHKGRLLVIFQPHRYSRTHNLGQQLGEAFHNCDLVVFTEIYAAGEKPIPGVNGKLVYEAALKAGINAVYLESPDEVKDFLNKNTLADDMVITMGAGDIWKVGMEFLEKQPENPAGQS